MSNDEIKKHLNDCGIKDESIPKQINKLFQGIAYMDYNNLYYSLNNFKDMLLSGELKQVPKENFKRLQERINEINKFR